MLLIKGRNKQTTFFFVKTLAQIFPSTKKQRRIQSLEKRLRKSSSQDFARQPRLWIKVRGYSIITSHLNCPFFKQPPARSHFITNDHNTTLRYFSPDTDIPLYNLFLFFQVVKKTKICTHPCNIHPCFCATNQTVRIK